MGQGAYAGEHRVPEREVIVCALERRQDLRIEERKAPERLQHCNQIPEGKRVDFAFFEVQVLDAAPAGTSIARVVRERQAAAIRVQHSVGSARRIGDHRTEVIRHDRDNIGHVIERQV